jgi:hypothetical protein
VETGGDTSATAKGFRHFFGTRWSVAEASGLTTELTTLGDIHRSAAYGRLLSLLQGKQTNKAQVIYTALVPRNSEAFFNSSAAAPAKWVTMFVGQSWTNTLVSLFGLHLQSSVRWTCWPASVTGPAARSFGKQLSSISQHDSDQPIPRMRPEVDEYLLSGLVMPCW